MNVQKGFVRGLPLTIVLTLLLHVSTAVWWVSAKAQENGFVERRVDRLEEIFGKADEVQGRVIERLARIEERISAQSLTLSRIEHQISGKSF